MGKSSPWQFISEAFESIDKYYGIEIKRSIKDNATNEIINCLALYGRSLLPQQVYAKCVDGKIRQGGLTDRLVIEMLATRHKCRYKEMNTELWETVLAKYGDPIYTYCFDSKTFHSEIVTSVGLYLMKHKCSKNIYNIILDNVNLMNIKVEQARAFDFYIKKEKSIMSKKDMFRQQLGEDFKFDSNYFAWEYTNRILSEKGPKQKDLDDNTQRLLRKASQEEDVAFCDLQYRVAIGMDFKDALKLGKEESEKYGFKSELCSRIADSHGYSYSINGSNYNFIMYIKYLASTEELEDIKIEE